VGSRRTLGKTGGSAVLDAERHHAERRVFLQRAFHLPGEGPTMASGKVSWGDTLHGTGRVTADRDSCLGPGGDPRSLEPVVITAERGSVFRRTIPWEKTLDSFFTVLLLS